MCFRPPHQRILTFNFCKLIVEGLCCVKGGGHDNDWAVEAANAANQSEDMASLHVPIYTIKYADEKVSENAPKTAIAAVHFLNEDFGKN